MANLQNNNYNSNADIMYSSDIEQSHTVCTESVTQCNATASTLLMQLMSDIAIFSKDADLSLKTEELELIKLQNSLLQLKYDLLQDTNETLVAENKAMTSRLEEYICSICLIKPKDCILEPCGHFVCCIPCIGMIPNAQCPVCRTKCNYYIKVFNS
jgi:hypothetical protein